MGGFFRKTLCRLVRFKKIDFVKTLLTGRPYHLSWQKRFNPQKRTGARSETRQPPNVLPLMRFNFAYVQNIHLKEFFRIK
jgi:hypothetical protein